MSSFIAPGAMLGVVGGGQLGRMFVHAAQRAGYAVTVLDPDADSPAGRVADVHLRADYLDPAALAEFGARCAAVTTEFENVPAAALDALASHAVVAPAAASVSVCQDRAREKAAFTACGIACAAHAVIDAAADLDDIGGGLFPGILKTSRLGYDGKGQRRVADRAALTVAYEELGRVACVLEQQVALASELSVVVARGVDGHVVQLPVQANAHRDGILAVTRVPAAAATEAQRSRAVALASRLADDLGYVGVLCVEFFVLDDGSLVANEMAPRPHNSGHHSIDSCDVSQFDLQLRTLVGAPLVAPRLHSPAVMLNLLGDLWRADDGAAREPDWARVLALPGAALHLYGKREPRAGRKMGHLTVTAPTLDAAEVVAGEAAAILGLARELPR